MSQNTEKFIKFHEMNRKNVASHPSVAMTTLISMSGYGTCLLMLDPLWQHSFFVVLHAWPRQLKGVNLE